MPGPVLSRARTGRIGHLPRLLGARVRHAASGRPPHISPADVESYRRDGVLPIRNLLSTGEVERLGYAIEWNLALPGPLAMTASLSDDPGRFFEVWRRLLVLKHADQLCMVSSCQRCIRGQHASHTPLRIAPLCELSIKSLFVAGFSQLGADPSVSGGDL